MSSYELPDVDEFEEDGAEAYEEDEGLLLEGGEEKPGMAKWVEALHSRRFSTLNNACVGQWLPDERLVVLVHDAQSGSKLLEAAVATLAPNMRAPWTWPCSARPGSCTRRRRWARGCCARRRR
jgi:hypothetical protein